LNPAKSNSRSICNLLPAYKKIATRFPVEQDDVLLMLKGRLKEMGMTIRQLRELEP
jgi:hypothetical protein